MENLLKFCCIPLPFTWALFRPWLNTGYAIERQILPLCVCTKDTSFLFSPPYWSLCDFIILFFSRTLLISLDFSNLHLEFAFMFCFLSFHPWFLQETPSNSLETRDQNAWGHMDMKFKLYYRNIWNKTQFQNTTVCYYFKGILENFSFQLGFLQ